MFPAMSLSMAVDRLFNDDDVSTDPFLTYAAKYWAANISPVRVLPPTTLHLAITLYDFVTQIARFSIRGMVSVPQKCDLLPNGT